MEAQDYFQEVVFINTLYDGEAAIRELGFVTNNNFLVDISLILNGAANAIAEALCKFFFGS